MQIILSGIGGQGIIFATKIIAEAAFVEGKRAISSEIHGMSQRGGSIITQVKIGNYLSGQVRKGNADYVVCFLKSELNNCIDYLKPAGNLILNDDVNSSVNQDFLNHIERNKINFSRINADKIAQELFLLKMTNLIMLGFSSSYWKKVLSKNSFCIAIEKISSKNTIEQNIKAFLVGSGLES